MAITKKRDGGVSHVKMRYTVRKQGIGWVVYDNQAGETVDGYPSRSETRAKCREFRVANDLKHRSVTELDGIETGKRGGKPRTFNP